MLEFIIDKKECTGCTACFNACPVKCISMIEDDEGFKYPVSDDRCIHCNKCERVCPVKKSNEQTKEYTNQQCVAAISNNDEVWLDSTSGGAFTEICNSFGDNETVVFGAQFNGLVVEHSYVIGTDKVRTFRKSKYVQSNLGNSFIKAEKFLKEKKKVIFSGVPCQIAGLKSYLNKEYENLLCIDLICHGVGSPKVFSDSLKQISINYKSDIIKYEFRNKRLKNNRHMDYSTRYVFKDNKEVIVDFDEYNKLFLSQLCVRPSCQENCVFRGENRNSDLTIADFKGKSRIFPYDTDERNYSTIVINSKKGESVLDNLQENMKIFAFDMSELMMYNPLFFKGTYSNPLRDSFFKDYINGEEITKLTKKYVKKNRRNILKRIATMIPYNIRLKIIRILKL